MSRRAIDTAIEKLFGKPRADVTTSEIIEALVQTPGDFYMGRERKKEVVEKLTKIAKAELEVWSAAVRTANPTFKMLSRAFREEKKHEMIPFCLFSNWCGPLPRR